NLQIWPFVQSPSRALITMAHYNYQTMEIPPQIAEILFNGWSGKILVLLLFLPFTTLLHWISLIQTRPNNPVIQTTGRELSIPIFPFLQKRAIASITPGQEARLFIQWIQKS